jgi:hypothetical protein
LAVKVCAVLLENVPSFVQLPEHVPLENDLYCLVTVPELLIPAIPESATLQTGVYEAVDTREVELGVDQLITGAALSILYLIITIPEPPLPPLV